MGRRRRATCGRGPVVKVCSFFFVKGWVRVWYPVVAKCLVVENVFTKESRKDVAAPLVGVAQWLKYAYLERWVRVRYPMLPTC